MKIYLFSGSAKIVGKSGVGQAVRHQAEMLANAGVEVLRKYGKDADLVQINTVLPDSFLEAVRMKLLGRKIVWYGHSTEEDFRNSFRFSNLLSPLFRRWLILCYSMADAVITPTEYARNILDGYGIPKPIFVLSNGVDTDRFRYSEEKRRAFRKRYGLDDHEKTVISVGHYMVRKGILDFIELARQMPSVRFFWFGYTAPFLRERRVSKALKNIPPNLILPGFVSSDELCEAYCGCDLFCFMSYEETEGIVVNEALASGAPVLLRDIPVYSSWLNEGQNVYKARSSGEFLKKSKAILSGELRDLTPEGRRTAENLDIRKISVKLVRYYNRVISNEKRKLTAC